MIDSKTSNQNFDLDGSKFLKELLQIVHIGTSYLQAITSASSNEINHPIPVEPMQFVLEKSRDLLSLVGFSQKTIYPLKKSKERNDITSDQHYECYIHGGEEKLVDEVIEMRRLIREFALKGLKSKNKEEINESMKDILRICDEMRNVNLPSMGIEVFDDKLQRNESTSDRWRWSNPIPKEKLSGILKEESRSTSKVPPNDITYENFFHYGAYKDMFLEFDETGLPLQNEDGSSVSKSLRKKLLKKRDKFFIKKKKLI